MALRCAEDPPLSCTCTFTGASVCLRLSLGLPAPYIDDLGHDQVGYPAGPGYRLVCFGLSYLENPIYRPSNSRSIGAAKIRA
jgi:hypothetical protein